MDEQRWDIIVDQLDRLEARLERLPCKEMYEKIARLDQKIINSNHADEKLEKYRNKQIALLGVVLSLVTIVNILVQLLKR